MDSTLGGAAGGIFGRDAELLPRFVRRGSSARRRSMGHVRDGGGAPTSCGAGRAPLRRGQADRSTCWPGEPLKATTPGEKTVRACRSGAAGGILAPPRCRPPRDRLGLVHALRRTESLKPAADGGSMTRPPPAACHPTPPRQSVRRSLHLSSLDR